MRRHAGRVAHHSVGASGPPGMVPKVTPAAAECLCGMLPLQCCSQVAAVRATSADRTAEIRRTVCARNGIIRLLPAAAVRHQMIRAGGEGGGDGRPDKAHPDGQTQHDAAGARPSQLQRRSCPEAIGGAMHGICTEKHLSHRAGTRAGRLTVPVWISCL